MSFPTVRCEIAFTSDPDSVTPNYVDVSPRLLNFSTNRGRQYELDTIQPGTCTVRLDNGDRAFEPGNSFSPFSPYVVPMRKIRLSATWLGVTYYLFTGFIESWPVVWDAPAWSSVTVTAVDAFAPLSQALISGSFSQELTGARIADVFAAASWPTLGRIAPGNYWTLDTSALDSGTQLGYQIPLTAIDTGFSLVQAVTIAAADEVSALQHIQDVAGADPGIFFVDGAGNLVFHDRRHRYNTATLSVFADSANLTSPTKIPYQNLIPSMDVTHVVNEVTVTATPGGAAQTVIDPPSQKQNLRRTLALTPPLVTDADALSRAQFELVVHKTPQFRFDTLTVMPQATDAAWPHVLGREISDKVMAQRSVATPSGTGPRFQITSFIEAIQHTVAPGSWQTTYQLSPAAFYSNFWTLDTSALDQQTTLAY